MNLLSRHMWHYNHLHCQSCCPPTLMRFDGMPKLHLRRKDPGRLVRSVCSLQWRLAEDIHQFIQKSTCKSQISRVQVKPDQVDVKQHFWISYEAMSEMPFRSVCFHSPSAFRECDFAYKNHTISTRSSRWMCLKVIRPWFFGAHEPSPRCFLCGKSIIPEVKYDIFWFSKRNGSYRHLVHQIWTKIAGYSRMFSAFYLALPSKPPWRGVLMVLLWRKMTLWMVVSWDLMALRLVLSFSLRELLRLQGVTLLMEEIRFTNWDEVNNGIFCISTGVGFLPSIAVPPDWYLWVNSDVGYGRIW